MAAARQNWSDDRLDGLNRRVDELGKGMEAGLAQIDADLRELNTRFDAFQRTLLQVSGVLTAALIGLIGTQL